LISLAAQHDRMNHLYNNRDKHFDLTAIERRTESELPTQISKIYDSLQRVQTISKEVEARVEKYNTIYRNATTLLVSLEKFGIEIRNKLVELDSLESNFQERKEGAHFLFEELTNLETWYGLFYTAYGELIFEIARRQKEHQRQQEIVDSYQRELNLLWKMESQKREHFHEYYGKYLPQSLCPAIRESAIRAQIFPEQFITELPKVAEIERPSRVAVDLALSQIGNVDSSVALHLVSPRMSNKSNLE